MSSRLWDSLSGLDWKWRPSVALETNAREPGLGAKMIKKKRRKKTPQIITLHCSFNYINLHKYIFICDSDSPIIGKGGAAGQ